MQLKLLCKREFIICIIHRDIPIIKMNMQKKKKIEINFLLFDSRSQQHLSNALEFCITVGNWL